MDRLTNPFAPGAGTAPPELAGRDELRARVNITLERLRRGRSEKSLLMVGLRGVGKTVLLERMQKEAHSSIQTLHIEAPEHRSLPALLAPALRLALLQLSRREHAKELAVRALRALAGFAKLKMSYSDIEVGLDFESEPGLADNGDLEQDMGALLEAAGLAAQASNGALALFIDELQYVREAELAALITALHRCAQQSLPITLVGAGLPQLRERMGNAKSYAERMFDFPVVGPLTPDAAMLAIRKPVEDAGASISDDALIRIIECTEGYPYFLQEWGKQAWNVAPSAPITVADVENASREVTAALDESFFRVRFDRLSPLQRRYLRAMADLGPAPIRSGDIAKALEREVTAIGPVRAQLISKGMIWSPRHGDNAFTVPLFDEFMKRIMPAP